MQVVKPLKLGLSTRCIEFRRRFGLAVTASLYFPFRPEGEAALWSEPSMWKFLATEMPEGPFIDEGCIKAHSEFLLRARAFAPKGHSQAVEVVATVAGRSKTAHVFGARRWQGRQPGAPEPFESLPLDWQHAFGGPRFADNPLGLGHRERAEDEPAGGQPLPQVLRPKQHPTGPFDVLEPIGFGPIDCSWPARARHAGTYDEQWLKEQFPGLASDIDWRYFNLAQPDQWFDKPPRGDEPFEFVHMHPTKALVGGALPGLRARVFADYGDGKVERLSEVPLRLATLWFFPHAEVGIALFQGLTECSEDDGSDIRTLLGAVERLVDPRTKAHYLEALQRRRDPKDGAMQSLREADLLPAGLPTADPDLDGSMADYRPDGLAALAARNGATLRLQIAIDEARAKGVDPDKIGLKLPAVEKAPTLEELPDYLAAQRKTLLNAQVSAALDAIEALNDARAKALQAGIDPASLVPRGPPSYRAEAHVAELQALAKVRPGAVDLAAMAPRLLQAEVMARQTYLATAHTQAPAQRLPAAPAAKLRAQVQAAHEERQSFLGCDFTGADFSGLDLSGADFSAAWLEGVSFNGARLVGAFFAGAVLAHADLSDADASDADFSGANLGGAKLNATRFMKANLSDAVLSNTALAQTDLRSASIDRLQMLDATFGVADWRLVRGSGLRFIKAQLGGMVFNRCELVEPLFIECDLSGVDFSAAIMKKATFIRCTARGAKFVQAQLDGLVLVESCDFSGADFSGAHLDKANLRGSVLKEVLFPQARMAGCDLSGADAQGADFRGAAMPGSLLMRTRLNGARMAESNLMNALLSNADLRGADLWRSNLHGSDLSRILADTQTRLEGANLDRARTYPRRTAPA
jgi:uncharacterized protein YjbI with pentapeptide repeats